MSRPLFDFTPRDYHLSLGVESKVMGIVNCTPDSFSGDGHLGELSVKYALRLIRDGADILDVGGVSTRPGASQVLVKEELQRVVPVINALIRKVKVPISIDTSQVDVAQAALEAGAVIVNNVYGSRISNKFLKKVRAYQAGLILMHSRGNAQTMRTKANYHNVVKEVIEELQIVIEKCLAIGIKKDKIIVDPGIGFAKDTQQNLVLINHLESLKALGCPILLGTSRKSFIGEVLNKPVANRLMGSAASVAVGVMRGAHIVRVHDVKQIKQTVQLTDAILNAKP